MHVSLTVRVVGIVCIQIRMVCAVYVQYVVFPVLLLQMTLTFNV